MIHTQCIQQHSPSPLTPREHAKFNISIWNNFKRDEWYYTFPRAQHSTNNEHGVKTRRKSLKTSNFSAFHSITSLSHVLQLHTVNRRKIHISRNLHFYVYITNEKWTSDDHILYCCVLGTFPSLHFLHVIIRRTFFFSAAAHTQKTFFCCWCLILSSRGKFTI